MDEAGEGVRAALAQDPGEAAFLERRARECGLDGLVPAVDDVGDTLEQAAFGSCGRNPYRRRVSALRADTRIAA